MTIEIRPYEATDWDAIARIHDLGRLEELRRSVGVEAFLSFEQTAEPEGHFVGEVWVAWLLPIRSFRVSQGPPSPAPFSRVLNKTTLGSRNAREGTPLSDRK